MTDKAEPCCEWSGDNVFNTGCGNCFIFNDGGAEENNFKFCPYCGLPIKEIDDSTVEKFGGGE